MMQLFLLYVLYGAIGGLSLILNEFIKRLFGNNIIITILLDIVTSIFIGVIYIYNFIMNSYGVFNVYELIGFLLGLAISLVSLYNLVANLGDFIYNSIKGSKWLHKISSPEKKNEKIKIEKIS